MKADEEACLVEESRQGEKEHEHVRMKLEEGVRLALEVRWIEEDL